MTGRDLPKNQERETTHAMPSVKHMFTHSVQSNYTDISDNMKLVICPLMDGK